MLNVYFFFYFLFFDLDSWSCRSSVFLFNYLDFYSNKKTNILRNLTKYYIHLDIKKIILNNNIKIPKILRIVKKVTIFLIIFHCNL